MSRPFRQMLRVSIVAVGIGTLSTISPAAELNYKPITVSTPDGLSIAAQEWGNPNGKEIIFIHGFAQSHLAWIRQIDSDLAKEFRIITYDMRGHGSSDKPLDRDKYRSTQAWGDELQAVLDAAGLKHPVVVAWSYGGRVVGDYLVTHGAGQLAGIVYADALTKTDPIFFGEGVKVQAKMFSEDLTTNISATRQFLFNCFEKQPTTENFEFMLAYNMMVPPKIREYLSGRPLNTDDQLKALKIPVLVSHGSVDRIIQVKMAKYTADIIPGAKLSIYEGAGHAAFYEDAPRFNSELAAFVRAANLK